MTLAAVALLEIDSIARGYLCLDVVIKRAAVTVKHACPVTPGKFLLLFGGEVAEVEEALEAGRACVADQLLDELWLPGAHPQLLPSVAGAIAPAPGEAIGVVETSSVAAALLAADVALKVTEVSVLKLHLAVGIGGKGYFTLAGDHADVEVAVDAAAAAAAERLVATEVIARPHPEVRGFFS